MRRRYADPEAGWQMPPGASAGQHKNDRGEHRPIAHSRYSATWWTRLPGGMSGSTSAHNSSGTSRRDN